MPADDSVIVDSAASLVLSKHLQCFRPNGRNEVNNYLNNDVINFVMELLHERSVRNSLDGSVFSSSSSGHSSSSARPPRIHFFTTFLVTFLSIEGKRYSYENAKSLARKLPAIVSSFDLVFVPIHVRFNHFCLAVIDVCNKHITYWDSLEGPDHNYLQVWLI
jgi:Ulp1 family protease